MFTKFTFTSNNTENNRISDEQYNNRLQNILTNISTLAENQNYEKIKQFIRLNRLNPNELMNDFLLTAFSAPARRGNRTQREALSYTDDGFGTKTLKILTNKWSYEMRDHFIDFINNLNDLDISAKRINNIINVFDNSQNGTHIYKFLGLIQNKITDASTISNINKFITNSLKSEPRLIITDLINNNVLKAVKENKKLISLKFTREVHEDTPLNENYVNFLIEIMKNNVSTLKLLELNFKEYQHEHLEKLFKSIIKFQRGYELELETLNLHNGKISVYTNGTPTLNSYSRNETLIEDFIADNKFVRNFDFEFNIRNYVDSKSRFQNYSGQERQIIKRRILPYFTQIINNNPIIKKMTLIERSYWHPNDEIRNLHEAFNNQLECNKQAQIASEEEFFNIFLGIASMRTNNFLDLLLGDIDEKPLLQKTKDFVALKEKEKIEKLQNKTGEQQEETGEQEKVQLHPPFNEFFSRVSEQNWSRIKAYSEEIIEKKQKIHEKYGDPKSLLYLPEDMLKDAIMRNFKPKHKTYRAFYSKIKDLEREMYRYHPSKRTEYVVNKDVLKFNKIQNRHGKVVKDNKDYYDRIEYHINRMKKCTNLRKIHFSLPQESLEEHIDDLVKIIEKNENLRELTLEFNQFPEKDLSTLLLTINNTVDSFDKLHLLKGLIDPNPNTCKNLRNLCAFIINTKINEMHFTFKTQFNAKIIKTILPKLFHTVSQNTCITSFKCLPDNYTSRDISNFKEFLKNRNLEKESKNRSSSNSGDSDNRKRKRESINDEENVPNRSGQIIDDEGKIVKKCKKK